MHIILKSPNTKKEEVQQPPEGEEKEQRSHARGSPAQRCHSHRRHRGKRSPGTPPKFSENILPSYDPYSPGRDAALRLLLGDGVKIALPLLSVPRALPRAWGREAGTASATGVSYCRIHALHSRHTHASAKRNDQVSAQRRRSSREEGRQRGAQRERRGISESTSENNFRLEKM